MSRVENGCIMGLLTVFNFSDGNGMVEIFAVDVGNFSDSELKRLAYLSLSSCRRKKIDSYRFEKDRLLSLGAGAALDFALRRHGLCEKDFEVFTGENGKPYSKNEKNLFFNLSHSGSFAVCAVSDGDVGVDIEKRRAITPSLIGRVCCENEKKLFDGLNSDETEKLFFAIWTAKESFSKLLGKGLTLAFGSICVYPHLGEKCGAEYPDGTLCPAFTVACAERSAFCRGTDFGEYSLSVCSERDCEMSLYFLTKRDLESMYLKQM